MEIAPGRCGDSSYTFSSGDGRKPNIGWLITPSELVNGWLVTSSGGMYVFCSNKLVQDGFNMPYNSYSHWCKQIVIGTRWAPMLIVAYL